MSARVMYSRDEETRPEWAAPVASLLDMVEAKLESTVRSDVSVAFDLAMHLFMAGGKRIRPALVLLSAMASSADADVDRAVNLAAATELVHVASLVHDDVVDETRERRGVSTANNTWTNKISVLGGDFQLSKAFSLLAEDGDVEVFRVLSSMAVGMTESEMLQAHSEGSIAAWQANYDRIIHGKTAAFMGACCECGALVGGASDQARRALCEYGIQLGYAFQITDDVLDIAGDPARTGKDVGTDLVNGKFTLPVLLALKNPKFQVAVPSLVLEGALTHEEAGGIAQRIIECGAVEAARSSAMECARKAREQLALVRQSDYVSALEMLADSVIGRTA
ncbi:MAG: polyprenyl synthetase family protein [Armatimonadota bacterium]